jgi:hypothetical protein
MSLTTKAIRPAHFIVNTGTFENFKEHHGMAHVRIAWRGVRSYVFVRSHDVRQFLREKERLSDATPVPEQKLFNWFETVDFVDGKNFTMK